MAKQIAARSKKTKGKAAAAVARKRDTSFETAMLEVTHNMPRHRRLFSAFLHQDVVSPASDILGSTLARPNAILFGAIFSFIATLLIYLLSKNLGYSMSGFESVGAFLVGWTVGNIFDALTYFFGKWKSR